MSEPVAQGSLRRNLTVMLLLGAVGLALLVYFIVQSVAREIAQESQDNVLAASAISILDSARVVEGEITIDFPYASLSMLDTVTNERVFYAIRRDGRFLTGYEDLPLPTEPATAATQFASDTFLGEPIRIATARRGLSSDAGASTLEVSVAQTLSGMTQTLARISRISMFVGGGFFLLAALLAVLISRATIRPLDRLAASVARRGPKDLRPVAAPIPMEMVPLVRSLNNFMSRLQRSLSRSEEFIAEAAHRVRTPLAIVRTKAEITLRRVEKQENREAIRDMIRAIDESSRTAGQLLDHAMVTFRADHLLDEDVDLAALTQDTIESLRPVSELKEMEITAEIRGTPHLRGDAILLQNALRNVLDNAIKYTPAGSTLSVTLHETDDQAVVTVQDNGPGFPKDDIDGLRYRFARGGNAAGTIGSGLGLTIVEDVVTAHGGRLTLSNTEGSGACVTISLPS
ncbi:MAG: sensor histidine kinase [Marivivens sp.]|nr:sensor histidine kinase [Marivivens sp.]